MVELTEKEVEEIQEVTPLLASSTSTTSETEGCAIRKSKEKSVRTKVPEVGIRLYRQGKGPIAVFNSALGGWDQDQLEVRDILNKYGLKAIFAYSPDSGRSVPIRFHPRNGRSLLSYKDGAVITVDGEPKDPLVKPITRILVGIAIITVLIALLYSDTPSWADKISLRGTRIPPWVITCAVIVFTRMRKRTRNLFQSRVG